MDVYLDFISCGISARPGCLDVIEELSFIVYSCSNYALIGYFDGRSHAFSVKHIFTGFKDTITCLCAYNNSAGIFLIFGDSQGYIYSQFIAHYEIEKLSPQTELISKLFSISHFKSSVEWIRLNLVHNQILIICGSYEQCSTFNISNQTLKFHKNYPSKETVLCGDVLCFPDTFFLLFGTQGGKLVIAKEEQEGYAAVQTLQCSSTWLTKIVVSVLFDHESACMVALGDSQGRIEFYKFQLASCGDSPVHVYWSFDIFNIYREGTIKGHESGHVYDMGWFRNVDCKEQPLMLYTTGDDRTVILWSSKFHSSGESSWFDYSRFGVVDSTTCYGFFGCKHINGFFLTYTGNGALYCWQYSSKSYQLRYLVTGHAGSVNCIQWLDQPGLIFVTCGDDFTSRIFEKTKRFGWIEVSRPQSHGFEVNSVFMGKDCRIFSAAAEKMIRVFMPTLNFYKIANCLGNNRKLYEKRSNEEIPISGSLRRLGLSNQIGRENQSGEDLHEEVIHDLNYPLNEEQLSSRTLWPEEDKLYGHSDRIVVLAGNEKINHLASATIANNEETASILIWKMDDGKLLHKLSCHRLTVFQIRYSPDGNYMLSVSRDRTWFVHKIIDNKYFAILPKEVFPRGMKHIRIILTADWCYNSKIFATGGKDNFLIFWSLTENMDKPFEFLCRYELDNAITAITFSKMKFACAVGTERGEIEIYKRSITWERVFKLPAQICPTMAIKSMEWNYDENNEILGVVSEDKSIRLYSVNNDSC